MFLISLLLFITFQQTKMAFHISKIIQNNLGQWNCLYLSIVQVSEM